ncbi:hypothetical protein ANN_25113 [Periplaneta americana]|uniref:Uncharacterized protein n=1 Tax=Periplaneta americana TaxID=6978 RepID=A0ABQ8S0Q4_PERAM|nr:hypothetical protein ANN_25113 [Periplaneta americana]
MSPRSSTESYPAFARIGLRENPGKNLNEVTCSDRDSNPGHLVSRPDALTITPQIYNNIIREITVKKVMIARIGKVDHPRNVDGFAERRCVRYDVVNAYLRALVFLNRRMRVAARLEHIKTLEKIQKRALKCCRKNSPLKWDTLTDRRTRIRLCALFKTYRVGRNLLFRNNSVPTPSCSLAQLLRARSTALHKCSDSELLTCPAVAGSQYRVAQGMFRLRDNSRNVGACSDEPTTAAVTLFSLFFMLYLELR